MIALIYQIRINVLGITKQSYVKHLLTAQTILTQMVNNVNKLVIVMKEIKMQMVLFSVFEHN